MSTIFFMLALVSSCRFLTLNKPRGSGTVERGILDELTRSQRGFLVINLQTHEVHYLM